MSYLTEEINKWKASTEGQDMLAKISDSDIELILIAGARAVLNSETNRIMAEKNAR